MPTMARIDPATNVVAGVIRPAGPASAPVVINGAAWVSVDTRPAAPRYLARLSSEQDAVDLALAPGPDFGVGATSSSPPGPPGSSMAGTTASCACRWPVSRPADRS